MTWLMVGRPELTCERFGKNEPKRCVYVTSWLPTGDLNVLSKFSK